MTEKCITFVFCFFYQILKVLLRMLNYYQQFLFPLNFALSLFPRGIRRKEEKVNIYLQFSESVHYITFVSNCRLRLFSFNLDNFNCSVAMVTLGKVTYLLTLHGWHVNMHI